MNLRLDWATHAAAKYACRNFHYSKSVPTPPLVKIGVYEDDAFKGVVIFSRGATSNSGKPFSLGPTQIAELTRVALTKHEAHVSKIISIAVKMLRKQESGLRLLISYADANQGHYGGIYQAGNWIYLGQTGETREYIDKRGRHWHSRQVSKTGFKKQYGARRRCAKTTECTAVQMVGKFKYAMPLDDEMKTKIEQLRKPYPKRASSKDSVASVFHTEESGAIPTDALPKP